MAMKRHLKQERKYRRKSEKDSVIIRLFAVFLYESTELFVMSRRGLHQRHYVTFMPAYSSPSIHKRMPMITITTAKSKRWEILKCKWNDYTGRGCYVGRRNYGKRKEAIK
jgi:hypothetical protein